MTQIYQNNSPVFIKVLNKKGVVKDYDSTLDQYFITYFNSKDKRDSNWFTTNQLAEFKNKDVHARSSNSDRLVRFDITKDIPQVTPDINKFTEMLASSYNFKEINDLLSQKTLSDGRKLYYDDSDKMIITTKETEYPVLESHKEENLKGEELIKRVEKLLQEWDNSKPFKFKYDEQLEFPVTNNQYDTHIQSLEKLVEGYKLVLSDLKNEKDSFEMVREFQKTFNLPAPDVPTVLSEETVLNRVGWTAEELIELLWSTAENKEQFTAMFTELYDRMYKDFKKMLDKPFEPENKLVNQADALIDQLYFVNGSLVELSIVPNTLLNIVHSANMSKLHNGKVVRNDQGKVVKPEGWVAPEPLIEKEIERQVELGAKRFK